MNNIDGVIEEKEENDDSKNEVSSFAKESEPTFKRTEQTEMQKVVEHELKDEETKPFITSKAVSIQLPPDLKKMGLESVNNPTQFTSYKNVVLPISDEEVIKDLHEPVTSTKRWLGELAKYILFKAHLVLREIGGKVIRVIKD